MIARTALSADQSWMLYDESQPAVIEITVDPAWVEWIYRSENVEKDTLYPARVHVVNAWIDTTLDSVGFGLRGNTSRHSHKKSFKISFNEWIKGRQLCDVEKLNLNGEHNDPSIMRSKVSWELLQRMGGIGSRSSHAAVYINDRYYGLYISVEHIDEEFIEKRFDDPTGNLWKCLWPADLRDRNPNPRDPVLYHPDPSTLRPYELKTNETLYDYTQLARLCDIINNTPLEQMVDSLEHVMDIHSLMIYFSFCILNGGWDSYWPLMNNYYLYHQPRDGRFTIITYDCDNSLGVDFFGYDWSRILPYNPPKIHLGDRPLAERILIIPELRNLYTHYLDFYSRSLLNPSTWEMKLDSIQQRLRPWAEQDTFRTKDYGFTLDDFNGSYLNGAYSNQHVTMSIKQFCRERRTSLVNQLNRIQAVPALYHYRWTPSTPSVDQALRIETAAYGINRIQSIVMIRQSGTAESEDSTILVSEPIDSSSRIIDHDRWTAEFEPHSLPERFSYYFHVTDEAGQTIRYPRSGMLTRELAGQAKNGIRLNELMAKNDGVIQDEFSQYDDWVELVNLSGEAVDLSGYYLSDNPDKPTKWKFGEGCIIPAGVYQLVWCDEEPQQGMWHAGIKLSADGEYVGLSDPSGKLIDSVTFPAQGKNSSWGRIVDGDGSWQMLTPTPGQSNAAVGIIETENGDPNSWEFYPNPATSSIRFLFHPPTPASISITIYDILGREVFQTELSGHSSNPVYYQWNLQSSRGYPLPSGIYFCRSGSYRKLMILR
ncbi:MAG: CotH kinase family protein [Candidatus Delongbacteria bacterium]|nr:CotH kinase family protein [Candidatus Delongbacteria bacterium]